MSGVGRHVGALRAIDMRLLSGEARHERHVQVIWLSKSGLTYDETAAQMGWAAPACLTFAGATRPAEPRHWADASGGRSVDDKHLPSAAQEAVVRKLVAVKTPEQLKVAYAPRNCLVAAELIGDRFGIELPVGTMGLHLWRWGSRSQRRSAEPMSSRSRR